MHKGNEYNAEWTYMRLKIRIHSSNQKTKKRVAKL